MQLTLVTLTFAFGYKLLVAILSSSLEIETYARQMLGHKLITKQTGKDGRACHKVSHSILKRYLWLTLQYLSGVGS